MKSNHKYDKKASVKPFFPRQILSAIQIISRHFVSTGLCFCCNEFSVKLQCHKNCNNSRKYVRNRLGIKYSIYATQFWKQKDNRNKTNPLPAGSKDKSLYTFSKSKKQRRIYSVKPKQEE